MYEARLAAIVIAIREGEHRYQRHALRMVRARGVTPLAFERSILVGDLEIIEDYPEYDPHNPSYRPCCLIRGELAGRVFHAVISYPPAPQVITLYWPDSEPQEWDAGFRRRTR